MSVMLHLFHGRDSVEQEMDDWGYDGPTLKFAMELEAYRVAFPEDTNPHVDWEIGSDGKPIGWVDGRIATESDLIPFNGKFYGDFSVSQVEPTAPEKAAPDMLAALKAMAALPVNKSWAPAEIAARDLAQAAIAKAEG